MIFLGVLRDLYLGADVSGCPLPCEIFSTETKVYTTNSENIGFGLNFQETVEVVMCGHCPLDTMHKVKSYQN